MEMKKLIAIAVIFLFIGVAVAPSISSIGIQTIIVSDNHPPNDPQISGPSKGRVGVTYLFNFWTTDPENQNISYFINWGDNTSNGWTYYCKSGQSVHYMHTFYKWDSYAIRCKAKDTLGAESNWSHMYVPMFVNASTDNDLVEVTSQACGIQGFGNTTAKLTKEQYQDLEQYLVKFRARLNQTTTREEAVPIFKDAVVELNMYGLLPKGMSVERAVKLVTGDDPNTIRIKSFEKRMHESYHGDVSDIVNWFCFIVAKGTKGSGVIDFNFFLVSFGLLLLFELLVFRNTLGIIPVFLLLFSQFKPFRIANKIILERCQLSTLGLLGKVSYQDTTNINILFFSGLKITTGLSPPNGIYLGFAVEVYRYS